MPFLPDAGFSMLNSPGLLLRDVFVLLYFLLVQEIFDLCLEDSAAAVAASTPHLLFSSSPHQINGEKKLEIDRETERASRAYVSSLPYLSKPSSVLLLRTTFSPSLLERSM